MNTNQMVQKFVSGSALRTINFILAALIGFFMLPFLVHALGDEQYGLWIFVGSILGFYGYLDFGLSTAVSRYVAASFGKQDYEQINKIVNTALMIYGVLGASIIVLTLVGTAIYSLNSPDSQLVTLLLAILGVNLGLQFPLRSFSGILSAQMRFEIPVYVDLFKLISRTILVVCFISQGFGILSLAIITFFVEIIGNLMLFKLTRRVATFITFKSRYIDKTLIKPFLTYSWAVFTINISETGRLRVIPIFVTSILGLTYTTIYGIALQLITYYEHFMQLAVLGLMSAISRFEGEGNRDLIWKTFHYATILNVLAAVFVGGTLLMYGDTFIALWIGEQYLQSYDILVILVIPFMLTLMQVPAKETFLALSRHTIYAIISVSGLAGIVIASFLFSFSTDTNSMAYATLIGMLIPELIKPLYVAKVLNVSALKVYRIYTETIIKAGGILGLYYLLVHQYLSTSYTSILVSLIGQTLIFVGFGYFFILPSHLRRVFNQSLIMPTLVRIRCKI